MAQGNMNRNSYRRNQKKTKELYIYESTVRQYQVEEIPQIERKEAGQRSLNRKRRQDQEYVNSMNRGYVVFLVLAAVMVFAFMAHYLQLLAASSGLQNEIVNYKDKTIELKAENDDYERRIERSVDIGRIQDIAINELGMVYPDKDQIVNYSYEESDYVRQYSDVPQE